ncbi:uncharacterized protein LDX57_004668 [Aspergillus melleus]|uniref:uncharacterized protein n=1 Tax=Aspergillus melleus TaxID=138277 RepID=UPI001E8D8F67|nr:uncharacterized protein LDX57_004668 [Aspergillus melleus]KAH8426945.1 hypothetical protein LDX57_004668 [Aspergillus melleus]
MHQVGVPVVVDQFEGMPHCFAMMMMETSAGRRFFDGMANFCSDAVANTVKSTGHINYITYKLRSTHKVSLDDAVPLSDEEVDERLRRCSTWRVEGEKQLLEEWSGRAKL